MRGFRTAVRLLLLIALVALVVPAAAVRPATLELSGVETAKSVDFEGGVVWVLVLGADADGNTDTIQLLGLNLHSGAAAGIGIPRDAWVNIPEGVGLDRINQAWQEGNAIPEVGGAELAARTVENLVGIAPEYVLVTGFEGFLAMTETVGEVEVRVPLAFETDEGLAVEQGLNRFDAVQALDFARSRGNLPRNDFDRMANHQALLLGFLRRIREREDEAGFMERVTLSALGGLETDLPPTDLYRLAQAVTQVDPAKVTGCIVLGRPATKFGASVVLPNTPQAQRLGQDAAEDAQLDPGCQG